MPILRFLRRWVLETRNEFVLELLGFRALLVAFALYVRRCVAAVGLRLGVVFVPRFVERVRITQWQKGDGFIIECKTDLTPAQVLRIREAWEKVYVGSQAIILDRNLELAAVCRKCDSPIAAAESSEKPQLFGELLFDSTQWDACQRRFADADCEGLPVTAAIVRSSAVEVPAIVLLIDLGGGRLRVLPFLDVVNRFDRVAIFQRFGVKRFAYDPWQCEEIARTIETDTQAERVAASFSKAVISGPLRELRWLVEEGKLEHGGGVLTVQAERFRVAVDGVGNMRPLLKWPSGAAFRGDFDAIVGVVLALALHRTQGSHDAKQSEVDRSTPAEAATDVGDVAGDADDEADGP